MSLKTLRVHCEGCRGKKEKNILKWSCGHSEGGGPSKEALISTKKQVVFTVVCMLHHHISTAANDGQRWQGVFRWVISAASHWVVTNPIQFFSFWNQSSRSSEGAVHELLSTDRQQRFMVQLKITTQNNHCKSYVNLRDNWKDILEIVQLWGWMAYSVVHVRAACLGLPPINLEITVFYQH